MLASVKKQETRHINAAANAPGLPLPLSYQAKRRLLGFPSVKICAYLRL